jgi:hypothetical protein
MDIDEAKNRITELFDAKDAAVEEVNDGGEKSFIVKNVGKAKKEDFKATGGFVGPQGVEMLWQSMIEMGYVNEAGRVQDKFFSTGKPEQIEFNGGVLKILRENGNLSAAQLSAFNALRLACTEPKRCFSIVADADREVRYIYFSGGATDRLFNTEGVSAPVFAYNFINAYLFKLETVAKWPEIDPQHVKPIYEYEGDPGVVIYSDKSLVIQRVVQKKDYKFD